MVKNRLIRNKLLLMAVILIAMLAMSGCRTRITNNSEVSNIYRDEEGIISETYQERRDELGLSTADRPIIPDLGGEEDPDDFDTSEEINLDYQKEEEEEPEQPKEETDKNKSTNNSSGTGTGTGRGTGGTGINNTSFTVKFNPGKEGKFIGKKKGEVQEKTVPKDTSVTMLSDVDVSRDGYKLSGWKDGDGKKVASGTSVKITKNVTYTAQWKKIEKPKAKYKVTFNDGKGNVLKEMEVEQGKAAAPPSDPALRGYKFSGWDQDFSIVNSDLNITAKWGKGDDLYEYWDEEFKEKTKSITVLPRCFVDGESPAFGTFVQDCKAYVSPKPDYYSSPDCECVIVFMDELKEEASEDEKKEWEQNRDDIIEKYKSFADTNNLLIISKYNSSEDKNMLAHKIAIVNWLHNGVEGLNQAEAETDLGESTTIYYPVTTTPQTPQTP